MQIDDLVTRVRALQEANGGRRILLGLAGEPGSGKSWVASTLAHALGNAVVAPMDGFHLANAELARLGRLDRKGAIDTFDGAGYLALLERLKHPDADVIYAPEYVRGLEESIGGSIAIPRSVPIVISEGNYLLAEADPWPRARRAFDEVWYVDTPREQRLAWLVERHVAFGMSQDAALAWANGPDEVNARLVRATQRLADLDVRIG